MTRCPALGYLASMSQEMTVREFASLGGKARAKALSTEQLRAIAMKGVKAKRRKRRRSPRKPPSGPA